MTENRLPQELEAQIQNVINADTDDFMTLAQMLDLNPRRDLVEANLIGVQLQRVNFRKANLQKINLQGANLEWGNLQKANLYQSNLQGANLRGANLRGANLRGANLRGAKIEKYKLIYIKLKRFLLYQENFLKIISSFFRIIIKIIFSFFRMIFEDNNSNTYFHDYTSFDRSVNIGRDAMNTRINSLTSSSNRTNNIFFFIILVVALGSLSWALVLRRNEGENQPRLEQPQSPTTSEPEVGQ